MVTTAQAIQHLFPASVPLVDWRVENHSDGNGDIITFWNVAIGTQPTPAQIAAVTQAMIDADTISTAHSLMIAALSGSDFEVKILRALMLVLLDEINSLRSALSLSARTKSQLITAMTNKINAGSADS